MLACVCMHACVCGCCWPVFQCASFVFVLILNYLLLTMYDSSCQCTVVLSRFLSHEGVY